MPLANRPCSHQTALPLHWIFAQFIGVWCGSEYLSAYPSLGGSMSKLDRNFRAALSFALVLIISSISALSSVAASNASRAATREDSDSGPGIGVLNAPVGSVTGTGHFTIDGDE